MKAQETENTPEEKTEMKTLVSCLNSLLKSGFEVQFKVSGGKLKSLATEKLYTPEEVKVSNFYRFEGESDPADNSILYAIETISGEKGTLVDAYGPYADEAVNKFMKEVEDMNKKNSKSDESNSE